MSMAQTLPMARAFPMAAKFTESMKSGLGSFSSSSAARSYPLFLVFFAAFFALAELHAQIAFFTNG